MQYNATNYFYYEAFFILQKKNSNCVCHAIHITCTRWELVSGRPVKPISFYELRKN